ncbi:hypothetical protein [Streptomyces sp. NPDC004682]
MDREKYNDKQKEALRRLLFHYPSKIMKGTGVHLNTARVLERLGLVTVERSLQTIWRGGIDKHGTEYLWFADLTPEGVQEALKLGYKPHGKDECITGVPCRLHTEGRSDSVPIPTLDKEPNEHQDELPGVGVADSACKAPAVSEPDPEKGKPVYHARTKRLIGYLRGKNFHPLEVPKDDE